MIKTKRKHKQNNMIQRLLKITHISEIIPAKNGRPYCTVRFESSNSQPDGTPILSAIGEGTRTVFAAFQDKEGNDFKADQLFTLIARGQAKVGMLIEGQVVKVRTTPYRILGSDFDSQSYTCVIFSHEDMIAYINKQLKNNYACVVDEYGVVTAPEQTLKPVAAPMSASAVGV